MCECGGSTSLGRFGAYAGGRLGDVIQNKGLKMLKTWTGFGDYKIVGNSLIEGSTMAEGGVPQIVTRGRATRIVYKEYIGELYTAPTIGGFNSVSFTVNPANLMCFPWLSTIATQYEQYIPHGIIFEFKSSASDTTTAASLGTVMIATDYDVQDSAYTSKMEMLNSAYSSESRSSNSQYHGIECDPDELQRKVFYGRSEGEVVTNPKDYDLCKTTFATQGGGLAANQSIGSIYIHYDIEFIKEQVWGGLPAKNTIMSLYTAPYTAEPTGYLQDFWDRRTLRYGADMGITITNNNFNFPRRWAGACIKVTVNCLGTSRFVSNVPTGNTDTFLTRVPWSWGNTGENYSNGWRFTAYGIETGGYDSSGTTVVKLNDIVNAPFATLGSVTFPLLPSVAPPYVSVSFEFQVVAKNYWS